MLLNMPRVFFKTAIVFTVFNVSDREFFLLLAATWPAILTGYLFFLMMMTLSNGNIPA